MNSIDKLKKLLDDFEKDIQNPLELEKTRLELEVKRQEIVNHELDKNIGYFFRNNGIPVSKKDLFMDDITRDELR